MHEQVLLEARQIIKSFGRLRVLRGADLVVRRGELVGITGENGSGKTTLLKILTGLLRADEGEVVVGGRLGYCPQEPHLFERLTVAENFAYFAVAYGVGDWRAAADRWLDRLQFGSFLKTVVSDLSGGTRQKLNLALSLVHEPDLLLLDEPYAGFDWETYLRFWELAEALRTDGCGVLVVSHFMYDRSRFARVCELKTGVLQCV